MSRELLSGKPVPEDYSHTEIDPATGMQKDYIVLSADERAKGFVKPVRRSYIHNVCASLTTMGRALEETYAHNPRFYSGTFCAGCHKHFNLDQFQFEDGEPMDPDRQQEWADKQERLRADKEGSDSSSSDKPNALNSETRAMQRLSLCKDRKALTHRRLRWKMERQLSKSTGSKWKWTCATPR